MLVNKYTPPTSTGTYVLADGVSICKLIEPIAEQYGWHVALTGGTLYGEGGRKDIDIVFYRIRQVTDPQFVEMCNHFKNRLHGIDLVLKEDFGFCKKFVLGEVIPIDALFPEDWVGTYGLDHLMTETETAT